MDTVRGHHEGSLYPLRRPTKHDPDRVVWVAAVSLPSGARRRRQAPSKAAAIRELAVLKRAATVQAIDASRIRLGDYLERWVSDDHDWAPSTRRKHESIVRVHLGRYFRDARLSDVSGRDVDRYLAQAAGLGGQTLRHHRATLRRALADAIRDGLLTTNAAALAKAPALRVRERGTLDAAQARHLLESTRDTRLGPLWTILVTTGLRISEALGLAWSDVELGGNDARPPVQGSPGLGPRVSAEGGLPGDGVLPVSVRHMGASITVRHALSRDNGEWVLRPPKTAKGRRTIPLTPLGVEALRTQREQQAADRGALSLEGLVFTTETGHPIHATNLLPKLRADLAAAGLPKVGLHDLRHSCATVLFGAGVPLPVISDILGHSTIRVTADLYRHRVPELSVEAARKMQEAVG